MFRSLVLRAPTVCLNKQLLLMTSCDRKRWTNTPLLQNRAALPDIGLAGGRGKKGADLQCSRRSRAAASHTSAWREAMMAVDNTPSMQAARTLLQCCGTLDCRGRGRASSSDSSSASRGSSGGSNAFRAIYTPTSFERMTFRSQPE